jgi:hypothetical protein
VFITNLPLNGHRIGAGEVIEQATTSGGVNVTIVKGSSTGAKPSDYRQSARIGTGVEHMAAIYNLETLSPISRSRGTKGA